MTNREIREAARKEMLRKQKEQREAEARERCESPHFPLYVKAKHELCPANGLDWAREAITSERKSGDALSLAVNSSRLLECFAKIYCDEVLTEAEKEAAYNKTLKEYEAACTRHYTVRPNYFEDLLAKFKALV